MPLGCVIDNMIFDKIAEEPGLAEQLAALTRQGNLELSVSSQQAEECKASGQEGLVSLIVEVPICVIGSTPFLVGVSRIGIDRLGPSEPYDSLRAHAASPKHTNDHLGVSTAGFEMLPFVTEDKRLHGFAASQPGVTIWSWSDLRRKIAGLAPPVAEYEREEKS